MYVLAPSFAWGSNYICQIFLIGLIMQLVSFVFFCAIYARFIYKVYTKEQDVCTRDSKQPWYNDWRALAGALAISCIGLLVRVACRQ